MDTHHAPQVETDGVKGLLGLVPESLSMQAYSGSLRAADQWLITTAQGRAYLDRRSETITLYPRDGRVRKGLWDRQPRQFKIENNAPTVGESWTFSESLPGSSPNDPWAATKTRAMGQILSVEGVEW